MDKKSVAWSLQTTIQLIFSLLVLYFLFVLFTSNLTSKNNNKFIAEKTALSIIEFVNNYEGEEEETFALGNYFNRQKEYKKKEKNFALFIFNNSIYLIKESDIEKVPKNDEKENLLKFAKIYGKKDFSFGEEIILKADISINPEWGEPPERTYFLIPPTRHIKKVNVLFNENDKKKQLLFYYYYK